MSSSLRRARLAFDPEFVASDGLKLAAYRFGGVGPPLLLVHATGFHAHVWLPMLDDLRAAFTVFAFDLRGHGESETPAAVEDYRHRRMGADVLSVADHFGVRRFFAIGHSIGAALVVKAELLRPGTVERAVLFEPIVIPPEQTDETAAATAARKRRHVFDSTEHMIDRWSERPPFGSFHPDALRAYVEYGVRDRADGTVELKCSRDAEVATFLQDTVSGTWAELDGYRTPTLILAGERSTSRVAPLAERQAARMPDARAERLAGYSHFLPFERPHEMAKRAMEFLSATAAGSKAVGGGRGGAALAPPDVE